MTRRFFCVLLHLTVATLPAGAQLAPQPVGVTARPSTPMLALALQAASAPVAASARPDSCALPRRIAVPLEAGAATIAGAITGWWLYTYSIGALASDDRVANRGRRQFVRGGALIGAVAGTVVAFTHPRRDLRRCPRHARR